MSEFSFVFALFVLFILFVFLFLTCVFRYFVRLFGNRVLWLTLFWQRSLPPGRALCP